ncbi:hypothetical protein H7F16_01100 [Gemmobacter straminiformis]|uniref:Uncharacterized protein n=2 Tax=Paragemmobacter straminiformis TaxID=2045119 RepID=A0A842I4L7_9RHOB|nr:hypothetical protein [Gemmobacter straminiformis]
MTKAELDAVAEVESLRKEALNNFDDELRTYKGRVSEARSDTSNIKLKIADAAHGLERLEGDYRNQLETALIRVKESQQKLDAFRLRHGVVGPPAAHSNMLLTVLFVTFMLLLESILNAQFFAKRNELGLVGGVLQAGMISAINVFIGYLAGFYARHKNLKGLSSALLGFGSIFIWIIVSLTINFAVAHFRDALEANSWNDAMKLAISTLIAKPLELSSLDSWMLFLIGLIVTLSSFLKGYYSADPLPGYNALWDSVERAIDDYAHSYGEAHASMDKEFKDLVQELRSEVDTRRANLRSAVDALDSRGAMLDGLRVFLRTTNGAANQLLAVYREANLASRKEPPPEYFNEVFSFGDADVTDRKLESLNVEFVEVEIRKMEDLVNVGVEKLTKAQKRSLQAFPTVQDIKAGRIEQRSGEDSHRFTRSIEDLDELFPADSTPVSDNPEPEPEPAKRSEESNDQVKKPAPKAAATKKRSASPRKKTTTADEGTVPTNPSGAPTRAAEENGDLFESERRSGGDNQ